MVRYFISYETNNGWGHGEAASARDALVRIGTLKEAGAAHIVVRDLSSRAWSTGELVASLAAQDALREPGQ